MRAADRDKLRKIDEGMATLAKIIKRPRGDRYWCLFERLERERALIADRDRRLDQAIARVENAA